jgi:hypothetical protein
LPGGLDHTVLKGLFADVNDVGGITMTVFMPMPVAMPMPMPMPMTVVVTHLH